MLCFYKNSFLKARACLLNNVQEKDSNKPKQVQKCILNPVERTRWSYFAKIGNGFYPLTIFTKNFIVDVRLDCKCASMISLHCSTHRWSAGLLKVKLSSFKRTHFICFNESLFKTMENAFYFTYKLFHSQDVYFFVLIFW